MTREALADRIITYSDALVAFSLVNALAFVIAMAEPDIRCSIVRISGFAIGLNLVIPVALCAVLFALRRFERGLRPEEGRDPTVERFWGVAQTVRYGLVWMFTLFVVAGLWAATHDPSCAPPG